ERYETEHNVPAIEIAAALARLAQGDTPLLMEPPSREARPEREITERGERPQRRDLAEFDKLPRQPRGEPMSWRPEPRIARDDGPPRPHKPKFDAPRAPDPGFATYWIAVGHAHQVKPGNIVGAIANEAGLEAAHIGRINIRTHDTLVDLPEGMPKEIMAHLKKVRVAGQALMLKAYDPSKDDSGEVGGDAPRFAKKPGFKPGGERAGGYKGKTFKPGFKGKRPD
ncbi:MAG TPA: ATP-dependent RNA helicase, partial [Xanthomonadaceae bacterium]|nr:ATP-dependent RNA helicase [Xanthomonadaceae bacterium]